MRILAPGAATRRNAMSVRSLIRRTRPALAAAGLVVAAGPDPAAAAVTVGSPLSARANLVAACRSPAGCTAAAASLGGRPVAVAQDGVIVRWRLRAATRGTAALHILRPAVGGADTAVRVGPRRPLDRRVRGGRDALYVFPERIRVERGDLVAVALGRGPAAIYPLRPGGGYTALGFEPALTGPQPRPPTSVLPGAELLLNADVEPDADGDGFGDESQDNCPSLPNDQTTNPCPSTAVPPPGATEPGSSGATSTRTTRFRRHKPKRGGTRAAR